MKHWHKEGIVRINDSTVNTLETSQRLWCLEVQCGREMLKAQNKGDTVPAPPGVQNTQPSPAP